MTPPEEVVEEAHPQKSTEEKEERMERIRQEIPQEPTSGAILRIRVVYPDGTKLQRNFMMSDKVGLLLDMVELDMFDHQMDVDAFQLYVTVPALCLDDVMERGWNDGVDEEGADL